MDLAIILSIIGLVVAVIIGAWQIILARKQLQTNDPKTLPNELRHLPTGKPALVLPAGKLALDLPVQVATPPFQPEYKTHPSAKQIISTLDQMPPLQRVNGAMAYGGIKVQWLVEFYSARELPNGELLMSTLYEGSYPWVYGYPDLTKYPELKITHKGQQLWIAGEIETVRANEIDLKDVQLAFIDHKH